MIGTEKAMKREKGTERVEMGEAQRNGETGQSRKDKEERNLRQG